MDFSSYWWQLIWIFFLGGFMTLLGFKRKEIVLGKEVTRWEPFAACIIAIPYILMIGFRDDSFGDTGAYRGTMLSAPSSLSKLPAYLETITKDRGYAVFTVIEKSIFGNSDVIFFIIIAAIQIGCLIYFYRKYSCDFWSSMFLFIASTELMSWGYNGIRQFLAMAIIIVNSRFLFEKKYIQMIIVVLIASTFHASMLIMLPIIFIVQGKAWNKKTILTIILTVVILFYINEFTNILDELLSNTQYSNMVTDWTEWEDDGTNPIRVFVYCIPMILSIIGLPQIRKLNDNFINIITNMSIMTAAIAVISMVTSGIFIGRMIALPAFYSTGLLLPWEIKNLFTKDSAFLMKIAMIIGYILFFYYQMHFTWGIL